MAGWPCSVQIYVLMVGGSGGVEQQTSGAMHLLAGVSEAFGLRSAYIPD